jgi:hypothetical protein
MSGAYGNENLMFIRNCSFITVDGTSQTITLNKDTKAVSLYAIADCWVEIGKVPVAAVPAELAQSNGTFFVPAGWGPDIPVPAGTDVGPIKLAAIQATAGGNLYVYERQDN